MVCFFLPVKYIYVTRKPVPKQPVHVFANTMPRTAVKELLQQQKHAYLCRIWGSKKMQALHSENLHSSIYYYFKESIINPLSNYHLLLQPLMPLHLPLVLHPVMQLLPHP